MIGLYYSNTGPVDKRHGKSGRYRENYNLDTYIKDEKKKNPYKSTE